MRIHHTPYDDNDNDTDVNDNDDDADDDVAEDSDYYNADEDDDGHDDDADEEDKEALAALVPAREDPRLSEWPAPSHNLTDAGVIIIIIGITIIIVITIVIVIGRFVFQKKICISFYTFKLSSMIFQLLPFKYKIPQLLCLSLSTSKPTQIKIIQNNPKVPDFLEL